MPPRKPPGMPKFMAEMAKVEELPSSMCFQQAWAARYFERISDAEYYHHVFAHLTGSIHERDETDIGIRSLMDHDPFAYTVLESAKAIGPIEDATPFEQVFNAYSSGDVDGIKSIVDRMEEKQVPYVLRMLAMQALVERKPGPLKFCLDRGGFEYEQKFIDKSDRVDEEKDPETFKVLEESDFRKKHARNAWMLEAARNLDVGGSHPVDW